MEAPGDTLGTQFQRDKMSNYDVIFDNITKKCYAKFRTLYHKIYHLKGHDLGALGDYYTENSSSS